MSQGLGDTMQGIGAYRQGRAAKEAAKEGAMAAIPQDILDIRAATADFNEQTLRDMYNPYGNMLPYANRNMQFLLNPSVQRGLFSGDAALGLASHVGDAMYPAALQRFHGQLDNIDARFGAQGHRVSSDLMRTRGRAMQDFENQYTADVLDRVPAYQQMLLGGYGAALGSNLAPISGTSQYQASRLGLVNPLNTSFTGFHPLLGADPLGAGMQVFGQGASAHGAGMQSIFGEMMGSGSMMGMGF